MRMLRAATIASIAFAAELLWPGTGWTQEPAAPSPAPAAQGGAQYSEADLEKLVGPIALYPDDLLAIILPASTYPLDVVKAQRFLEKLKADPNLKPDASLPEPVRNLLNYPEVVKKMSDDLDWVQALGEAVVSQQGAVMDAIQAFRRKASAAGNLKTDEKQIVVQEKEVIKVVPANPEVVYVPQYQPTTVVVQSAPPVYYPTAYPSYYYPYPPGAAMATGFFFGAATAYAFNWGGSEIEQNVNINRTDNLNTTRNTTRNQESVNRARQTASQRTQTQGAGQGAGQNWRSGKQPGQVRSGQAQSRSAARPGDAQYGGQGRAGAGASRASAGNAGAGRAAGAGAGAGGPNAGARQPSAQSRAGAGAGGRASAGGSGGGGNAFSGVGSGSSAARASSRGATSRAGSGARAGGGGGRRR